MNNEMSIVLGTVAMEPKGEYNSETYYEKLNTVLYNDSTYMAKESVQGENPSTSSKWQLIGGGLTREDIVDNLDSNDATKMLSAKQGKILDKKIRDNILCELNFRKYSELEVDSTELYENVEHDYLQGFCEVNGNIIMGLRNSSNSDDYVRLVEYNPTTNTVVRSTYLVLYHCNAISYNEKNNSLYVASCSKVDNGTTVQENSIKVVDYATFSIIKTINVNNIPENHRIRSVYYDNNNEILYGGDIYDMYVIDETNQTITQSINLDNTGLDQTITNQTLKKYKDMYVGVYLTYIVFWDLEGNLIRIININRYYTGEKIGEVEDFFILENGDIYIGSIKKLNGYRNTRTIQFYETNLAINNSNNLGVSLGGRDDNPLVIYVDNTSNQIIENGTSQYPYKDLQKAIHLGRNLNEYLTINISGTGTYEICSIFGCKKINLKFNTDVIVNGLFITNSNVHIETQGHNAVINGLCCIKSSLYFIGDASTKPTINYFNDSNISSGINGRAIYTEFSNLYISNCLINGNNSNYCCDINNFSCAGFDSCRFDNYTGTYAINIGYLSQVNLNRNTFSITHTSTQKLFRVTNSSILNTQYNLYHKENYLISYYGKVYGRNIYESSISDVYYGDVCTVDTGYTMMRLKIKIGGASKYKYVDIPTSESNDVVIDTSWIDSSNVNINTMILKIDNGTLKITEHRKVALSNDGTYTYETITATPSDTSAYSCVKYLYYYND